MRRAIAPVLEGAGLEHVEIRDPRLVRPFDPEIVAGELVGERVAEVGRRGKYLIVGFDSGRSLLVHLRMTGSLRTAARGALADDPHTRAVLRLDNGSDVAYRDVRRFGTWELFGQDELQPYLKARLGPEPLGPLSAARLGARLEGRRAPLKSALLDQRTIAGLGQHLRRRGPLAEPAASAPGGRQPRPRRARPAAPGGPRRPAQGGRAPGLDAARLRAPRRRLRHDAGRVPRLRAGRRAVRPLRDAARPHRRRRARDDVLPACQTLSG